jgi:hypothetical protein
MTDHILRENLAGITAREQERVATEKVQEHFLSGIARCGDWNEAWPTLNDAALHGLAGEVVKLFEPHTEADNVALLASLLAEVGAMLNRAPHLILDGTLHPLLFWPVLVGQSSKSRKGTAGKRIETMLALADPTWTRGIRKGTLSSGEGLVYAVCDPEFKEKEVKGKTVRECIEEGVEDKRLFLVQPEFGAVLRIMARDGNSLSGVLRDAWDGLTLAPMTKANRVRATHPHIGIVGHITKDELLRNLTDTEASNGFGNRFVWLAVKRSKELPEPGNPDEGTVTALCTKIRQVIQFGRSLGTIGKTELAREAWRRVYGDLSDDRPGLAGSLLGRAEAQVMRLAALYAILDHQSAVDLVHLEAALALWQYAERSTQLVFGDSLGDADADVIVKALEAGDLSDSDLSNLFGRHRSAARLEQVKAILLRTQRAHRETIGTGGRPRIVWRLGAKKA